MNEAVVQRAKVVPSVYGGLFFTTLSTLMYEILLTRIFSVTMWYHFAFVAVSVALFGLTVGALIVYLAPKLFPDERTKERLAQASLLFSLSIVVSFVLQLRIPFEPEWSVVAVSRVGLLYLLISVPFTFSGITVVLALTRFPRHVSTLYAVDLAGASLGAVTLILLLNLLKDGPSAILFIAVLSAVGAWFFSHAVGRWQTVGLATIGVFLLAALAAWSAISVQNDDPILRVSWVKGEKEPTQLYETWNTFSRLTVSGDPNRRGPPIAWGISPAYSPAQVLRLELHIDASAGTPLVHYDGRLETVEFLRYDVVNLVHYLRPNARVFVIGSGGGRDVLTALLFEQQSVKAVELNGDILKVVNGRYGDFTGHLDQQPGVTFVTDEARSYLARSDERFDIIHLSLIDTWAATAAGAFALSESSLYTVEAWQTFFEHLNNRGVLSVSRWYFHSQPAEAYRLTSLAAEALRSVGISRPRDHIIFVKSPARGEFGLGVGTILVSREPFSASDITIMQRVADDLRFELVLAPDRARGDPIFAKIAETADSGSLDLGFPADISAPTDDRPFFFQMFRFQDLFDPAFYTDTDPFLFLSRDPFLSKPVVVLFSLVIVVLALTGVFILLPLLLTTSRQALQGMLPFIIFFSGIGLGFLLLEISQMQRLTIFLGHPTYALSVVLFSLLLFSGLGSLTTERLVQPSPKAALRLSLLVPLVVLLVVLVMFGFVTPYIIDRFETETTPVRILTAVGILAPMGLVMGMPFPLGMKVASLRPNAPTAFFWGINGATSVCASVLAVAIAIGWGISTAFWVGCLSYVAAAAALGFVVARGRV